MLCKRRFFLVYTHQMRKSRLCKAALSFSLTLQLYFFPYTIIPCCSHSAISLPHHLFTITTNPPLLIMHQYPQPRTTKLRPPDTPLPRLPPHQLQVAQLPSLLPEATSWTKSCYILMSVNMRHEIQGGLQG